MRIKLYEGRIVEVNTVGVCSHSTNIDSFDEKYYDRYGMSACDDDAAYDWWYSLEEYTLEEAKAKVASHMDKLLKDGWIDMTGIPYDVFIFDEDYDEDTETAE